MTRRFVRAASTLMFAICVLIQSADAQVVIRGETVYTMAGDAITDGVVVIRDGKIAAVGSANNVDIPDGFRVLSAKVVTPGLVDVHNAVGLTGWLNYDHDQEQLEHSAPIQPELRAVDAYNARDPLVKWIREFGVTTVHTGHAPGELISGQTMIVKTAGETVEDAVLVKEVAIAATMSEDARKSGGKSPGSRAKMVAMLRAELIKSREYVEKLDKAEADKKPDRDLKLEALAPVIKRKLPLLVTVHRSQDIVSVLRLAKEFDIDVWLDGAAECYLLLDDIKAANIPVLLHPSMARAFGEMENASFETASKLKEAGIPFAIQGGYESYVPKVRVVLYEAAIAAANGLSFDEALASITIDAARILGVDQRVGSLETGKDGDVALYDGDPFEYTTHCVGVVIDGNVVSDEPH